MRDEVQEKIDDLLEAKQLFEELADGCGDTHKTARLMFRRAVAAIEEARGFAEAGVTAYPKEG